VLDRVHATSESEEAGMPFVIEAGRDGLVATAQIFRK
jgi:hypothetical protein